MRVTTWGALAPVGLVALVAVAGCNLGTPAALYPVDPSVRTGSDLAAGDVDGDGDLDLVVSELRSYAVATNDGEGRFSATSVPAASMGRGPVALADVDGDGALDLVHHAVRATHVDVRRGDGAGRFSTTRTVLASPDQLAGGLVVTDLDSDGDRDVMAGTSFGAVVWHRDGATFGPPVGVDVVELAQSIAVGDLDGDGAGDLIVGATPGSMPAVFVALGDGAGGFGPPQRYGTELLGGPGRLQVGVADVTGDGLPDVIAGSDDEEPAVVLLRGDGQGGFDNTATYEAGARTTRITAADLDGDGGLDVVNDDSVLFGDGAGGLTDMHAVVGGARPLAIDVGGDDRADHVSLSGSSIRVLLNDLDGRTHPGA